MHHRSQIYLFGIPAEIPYQEVLNEVRHVKGFVLLESYRYISVGVRRDYVITLAEVHDWKDSYMAAVFLRGIPYLLRLMSPPGQPYSKQTPETVLRAAYKQLINGVWVS